MSESQPKINVIVFSDSMNLTKSLQEIKDTDRNQIFKPFPTNNIPKVLEYLEKFKIQLIVFDEKMKSQTKLFFDQIKSKTSVPVYYVSSDTALLTEPILNEGFTDLFFNPLDHYLFIQKTQLDTKIHLGGKMLYDESVMLPMKVSFEVQATSLSEYSATVSTPHAVSKGAIINLTHQDDKGKYFRTSGVVISCAPSETFFAIQILFRGSNPSVIQSIRRIMKTEFAKKNQAS